LEDVGGAFSISSSADSVAINDTIFFALSNPQSGVIYELQTGGFIVDSDTSDGGSLLLWHEVTSDASYSIIALDTLSACSLVLSEVYSISTYCPVQDVDGLFTIVSSADSVMTNDTVVFTMTNSQEGVIYDFVAGGSIVDVDTSDGGVITFSHVLVSDELFTFVAIDTFSDCSINLSDTFNITTYCSLQDVGGLFTISTSADSVPINDAVFFTLLNSQSGVVYDFEMGGNIVATDTSDGGVITFSQMLIADATFSFVATDTVNDCSITLSVTFDILAYCPIENVGGSFSISASADSVTINDTVFFTLTNSQVGVVYELEMDGDVINADTSDGSVIIFSQVLTADASFTIVASDTSSNCSVTLNEIFDVTAYCPLSDLGGGFTIAASADSVLINDTIFFTLSNSQSGVIYDLEMSGNVIDSDTSDGGVISFSQVLSTDETFLIIARDTFSGCSLILSEAFDITTYCGIAGLDGSYDINIASDQLDEGDSLVLNFMSPDASVEYVVSITGLDNDTLVISNDSSLVVFISQDVKVEVTALNDDCDKLLLTDSVYYNVVDCNTIFGVQASDLEVSKETCYDTISLSLDYSGVLDSVKWTSNQFSVLIDQEYELTTLFSGLELGSNEMISTVHYGNCSLVVNHEVTFNDDALSCFPSSVFNMVSPNDDGVHDYLKIKNIERYSVVNFTVFDRTGQKVYEVNNYDASSYFKGISNVIMEIALKDDVYYYQLKVEEVEEVYRGHLLLKN
jgi:gliding motility-associated-like protein